jgi:nucleotide-binding universal stress UspA family protein
MDGSRSSIDALRWAVAEATLRRAPPRIVHVSPTQPDEAPPEQREVPAPAGKAPNLAAVRAEVDDQPTLETSSDVRVGHVADELIQAAASAQLLVVGARGGGGFDGLLLGSISSQCVMYAPCPVAVIR